MYLSLLIVKQCRQVCLKNFRSGMLWTEVLNILGIIHLVNRQDLNEFYNYITSQTY